jgi:hypothetical protein
MEEEDSLCIVGKVYVTGLGMALELKEITYALR